jgi:hypothetical protein
MGKGGGEVREDGCAVFFFGYLIEDEDACCVLVADDSLVSSYWNEE